MSTWPKYDNMTDTQLQRELMQARECYEAGCPDISPEEFDHISSLLEQRRKDGLSPLRSVIEKIAWILIIIFLAGISCLASK